MRRFRRKFRPKPLTVRRKVVLGLAVALPVLAIFTFGSRGLLRRVQLEMEVGDLRRQVYAERSVTDSLKREIHRYTVDSSSIERLARERYGMARQGETIYKVEERNEQ